MTDASVISNAYKNSVGCYDNKAQRYFARDKTLSNSKVVELLVSNSFGANSILYAVWLGYLMGMWALIIHIAWCCSFCLLRKYSKKIYTHNSIHDFLGQIFGPATKKVAAICSIIGLLYFSGWEIGIAKSSLLSFTDSFYNVKPYFSTAVITGVIIIALLYTTLGGQQLNGFINIIANKIKTILLCIIVVSIIYVLSYGNELSASILFPKFSTAIKSLGITGLVANFLLNLSWQFVDNSSWQIISAGENYGQYSMDNTNKVLKITAIRVFFIYFTETLLGSLLRLSPELNSNSIMSGITDVFSNNIFIGVCVISLLLLSMMSLIDGMSLSISQTFIIDFNLKKLLYKLKIYKASDYTTARLITLIFGIISAWGIQFTLYRLGISIFDFVYIFTIVPLSMIGPILVGLILRKKDVKNIWISILLSMVMGLLFSAISRLYNIAWLGDIASVITIFLSIAISLFIYVKSKESKKNA